MKDSKQNWDLTNEIVDSVIKDVDTHRKNKYKQSQLKVMLQPTISNALFNRDKEILEAERFTTLVSLARVLDDENMKKAVIGLNYKLIVEKK